MNEGLAVLPSDCYRVLRVRTDNLGEIGSPFVFPDFFFTYCIRRILTSMSGRASGMPLTSVWP